MLYRVLANHLQDFIQQVEADPDRSGLPTFVKRELFGYLDCGLLSKGFVRVHCLTCGRDALVAFSCKGRGFCPCCGGRRMADMAAHLVDHVLPAVRVRQWVLSLPPQLRYLLAFHPEVCRQVRGIFMRSVLGFYRRRALRQQQVDGRCGAVTVLQRFDSALRLDPHFHAVVLDGVFTGLEEGSVPRFQRAKALHDKEVAWLCRHVRRLILGHLQRRGFLDADEGLATDSFDEHNALTVCQAAAVQGKIPFGASAGAQVTQLGLFAEMSAQDARVSSNKKRLCTDVGGFSLHAGVHVKAGKRKKLEHLCRYLLRPAVCGERLTMTRRGQVVYRFRHPWRNGTQAVLMSPMTFISRLAALVPYPRAHVLTYHGVLAPAAKGRRKVVPPLVEAVGNATRSLPDASRRTWLGGVRRRRLLWAELMQRVFLRDVLQCDACGGRRRVLRFVLEGRAVTRILRHLGLPTTAPPIASARASPGMLPFA